MKILKRGKKERIKTFQFECRKCGCIFIAQEQETRIRMNESETFYRVCDCPCCGRDVRKMDMDLTMEFPIWIRKKENMNNYEKKSNYNYCCSLW